MHSPSIDKSQTAVFRRGSAYMLVVYTTTIVATIGLGAILSLRGQANMAKNTSDLLEARQYALAAIEAGRAKITGDPSWRTNNANGTWINNQPVGDHTRTPSCAGTYSLTVVNPNGPLNRLDTDPVIMTATGYKGSAVQKVQVTLVASVIPLTCLNTSLTSGGAFTISGSAITAFNQLFAFNTTGSSGTTGICANVEYVTSISGTNYQQSTVQVTTPRTMPDSKVFDFYKTNGTWINYSDTAGAIAGKLISPNNNPYGAGVKNPSGIYVIDCLGNNITITKTRVVGTLVLLNPGPTSFCQTSVNMSPAIANYPILMVQGDWTIKTNASLLSESGAALNFNPAGASPPGTATPYPWGSASYDNDMTDSFPSEHNGLVYVSGNFSQNSSSTLGMVVAGGTVTLSGPTFSFNPVYYSNPPPGFYTVQMITASNGYLQTTN